MKFINNHLFSFYFWSGTTFLIRQKVLSGTNKTPLERGNAEEQKGVTFLVESRHFWWERVRDKMDQ